MDPVQKQWIARMRKLDSVLRSELRSAYDGRIVLAELVEKTRTLSSRQELALLVQKLIPDALHPKSFVCYFELDASRLNAVCGVESAVSETIPTTLPFLDVLARSGRAWVASRSNKNVELGVLSTLAPECVVPIPARDGHLIGLMILGARASGGPYSMQDVALLESAATQVGIALENLRLAEQIAQRIEAARRMQQEIEFARQVQVRLLPQKCPPLNTLDYLGRCVQARRVGGDYYDFLEMRPGRVAFVLADIAGKGLSGALLMANLQANLRSQYPMALEDPKGLLVSVNGLFYDNTDEASYATLFFADYDDGTRHLRYANCGHLPPLLLRPGPGKPQVQRLTATSTVLGLFKEWECNIAETQLQPGDTLVMYTDGVTEATDEEGNEFGQDRLLEVLSDNLDLSGPALLGLVLDEVRQFGKGEQADDITLVVARCHR